MYSLYFLPSACSLATQVVLRELDQPFELIHRDNQEAFATINPVNAVPALVEQQTIYTEGAAIMWYLLTKHPSYLLGQNPAERNTALMDIMFANATMHPAYGRLFFLSQHNDAANQFAELFESAANAISKLWTVVESRLEGQSFLGGDHVSAADIMLAVYARWGSMFPVEIKIGPNAQKMIDHVHDMPSFVAALEAEQKKS